MWENEKYDILTIYSPNYSMQAKSLTMLAETNENQRLQKYLFFEKNKDTKLCWKAQCKLSGEISFNDWKRKFWLKVWNSVNVVKVRVFFRIS